MPLPKRQWSGSSKSRPPYEFIPTINTHRSDTEPEANKRTHHSHLFSYQLTSIELQLRDLSASSSDQTEDLQALVKNHHDDLKAYITEQLSSTLSKMQEDGPRLPRLHQNVLRTRAKASESNRVNKPRVTRPNQNEKLQVDGVRVGFRRNQTWCSQGCPCRCHGTSRVKTPDAVSRVLGQLFVGYSGIPAIKPECDQPSCKQTTESKVEAEFWFPAKIFWSRILQFQASYQAATGPSLALRTFRCVPDSAPAVSYTVNGNIDALKVLFKQGMASPVDVSDTRGYSLLRVSPLRFLS